MKEAQPIAEAGSLNIEAAQATRRSAADGGEVARTADASQAPADAGTNGQGAETDAALAPEVADRFAMAFRPSWEPPAPTSAGAGDNIRFKSFAPRASMSPAPPSAVQDASGFLQDDLLRLRAARVRIRSLALAAVSILSFGGLMYWGISSTTDGAGSSGTRALQPPQAAERKVEEPASPLPQAPAPQPEPTRLSARLADPTAPPAPPPAAATENDAPAAAAAAATDVAAQAPEDSVAVQRPNAEPPSAASPEAQPAAETKPLAAAPVHTQPANAEPPTTITDVKPATAAAEVKPPTAAGEAKPAADPKTAPLAAATEQKPAPSASAPAAAVKPAPATGDLALAPAKPAPAGSELAAAPRAAATQPPAAAIKAAPAEQTSDAAKARPPLLEVRAVPDSAQLFLDGQAVSNPFDTRLPLGSKHKIDARQDGFETSSQSIRLEADAKLTITLKRTTPAPEPHLKVRALPESANGAGFVTSNPY